MKKKIDDTWPKPIGEAAYHGLVGDVVDKILPETEADAAILLTTFLVFFGNSIGRSAYMMIEATPHFMNEFLLVVGSTSVGRKGTALDRIKKIFKRAEEINRRNQMWTDRIKYGLSTGEGLIAQFVPRKKDDEDDDAPPIDKRMLVVESEFARTLTVINRPDSTLSSIMRCAWDGTPLAVMTRKDPLEVNDSYVSIIGHTTDDEVRKLLTDTQRANGFGNRFLWASSKRSKELPFGGNSINYDDLASRLGEAQVFARKVESIIWGDDAEEMWPKHYKRLTAPRHGMLGALTDRAAPHVLRLSAIYALLDQSKVLKASHLRAALEVWRYCEDSAKHIFGSSLGDATADAIWRELKRHEDGLTRTEIHNLFNRNMSSAEIDRVMGKLEDYGLAALEKIETGKRPREVWRSIIR